MKKIILLGLPIGHPQDLSLRGHQALKEGRFFFAEDTRKFKELLRYFKIALDEKKIISFHEYVSDEIFEKIFAYLEEFKILYVVSDAGSAYLSDPAYPLIQWAMKNNIPWETFPGPSSLIAGLELSGLPPLPLFFWGFIPRTILKQRDFFKKIKMLNGTSSFFESPKRLEDTLKVASEYFSQEKITVVKEITKTHQAIYRKEALQSIDYRGEFVVFINNHANHPSNEQQRPHTIAQEIDLDLLGDLSLQYLENGKTKILSKIFAHILGKTPSEIYTQMMSLKK